MAEVVVVHVVERLCQLLTEEAALLDGVRDQVTWLQTELTRMQCFLKDADEKQEADESVRNWVSQVRNAAYDTEDIVDTFMLRSATEKTGCCAPVNKFLCICNRGMYLHRLGKNIEELKKRILDISRSRETYGIRAISDIEGRRSTERFRQLRKTSSYAGKEDVVGFEDNTRILVEQLLKNERQRCVISIFGMGGLGKTTLARKLCNRGDVRGRFHCHAWICVSQEYRTRDLLQKTIKSFQIPTKENLELMEMMTEEDLERHLYEFLDRQRYLVVIDDVWDREAWESLRRALPDNENGSRVILTTRKKTVATITDERNFVYQLQFLKQEESWELFCKKAFPDTTDGQTSNCPPGLRKLGREMVERCRGLPLAIIVLGGLLSRKQPQEWHTVKNHLWMHLTKDSDHVSPILALSYNELPYQLKPCFLYLSIFPEDFVIDTEKLIRLWIAEGFIPQGEEEMEDVAEEYLKELIDRSMIQVAERYLDKVKACRIHDLVRELSVRKAKALHFLDVFDGKINSPPSFSSLSRRQATHSGNLNCVSLVHLNPQLRSLLFFNPDRESLKAMHLRTIYSRLILLRMLDLEDTRIEASSPKRKVVMLPDAIGKLIHLRYFGFKSSTTVEFPSSIGNLRSLKTLVATGNALWKLPAEIGKLHNLRHLIVSFHGHLEATKQIGSLTSLRTLKYIKFQLWDKIQAMNLINLRELEIREIPYRDRMNYIVQLKGLRTLTLQTDGAFNTLLPLSQCQHLTKLKLDGNISSPPGKVDEFPPNLTTLILKGSQLGQESISILEKLPNLTILDLGLDSFSGSKLVLSEEGFSQLHVLRFSWLRSLKTLEVESGAMPRLKYFSIEDCNELLTVPERLRKLPLPQEW